MNAATAATPSSPVKTSIGLGFHVKNVNRTTAMKNGSVTGQSNQPTGAGEQSALVCVFCGITLADAETYCCENCVEEIWASDPNGLMGVDDEQPQNTGT